MPITELTPFFGRMCNVTVRCPACGRDHDLRGVLRPGPHRGDVILAGVVYNIDDLVTVSADAQTRIPLLSLSRILPYAGIAGLLAAWAHLVRR